MKARLLFLLALLPALLFASAVELQCSPKPVVKAACDCCADISHSDCGMTAVPNCGTPVPVDRESQQILKASVAPALVVVGELDVVIPVRQIFSSSRQAELIPSPPPLERHCILLV